MSSRNLNSGQHFPSTQDFKNGLYLELGGNSKEKIPQHIQIDFCSLLFQYPKILDEKDAKTQNRRKIYRLIFFQDFDMLQSLKAMAVSTDLIIRILDRLLK